MLLTPFATCSTRPKLTLASLDLSSTFLKPDREWDGGEKGYGLADGFTLTQASHTHPHAHMHTHSLITSLSSWETGSDTSSNFLKYWSARVKHVLIRRAIYGRGLSPEAQPFSSGGTFSSSDSPRTGWNIALWAQQSGRQQNDCRYLGHTFGGWAMTDRASWVCTNKTTHKNVEKGIFQECLHSTRIHDIHYLKSLRNVWLPAWSFLLFYKCKTKPAWVVRIKHKGIYSRITTIVFRW